MRDDNLQVSEVSAMAEASKTTPYDPYPRGEADPAHRYAFQAWVVMFLLILCYSLAHYLAMWAKSRL
jgi:hypothetical protein